MTLADSPGSGADVGARGKIVLAAGVSNSRLCNRRARNAAGSVSIPAPAASAPVTVVPANPATSRNARRRTVPFTSSGFRSPLTLGSRGAAPGEAGRAHFGVRPNASGHRPADATSARAGQPISSSSESASGHALTWVQVDKCLHRCISPLPGAHCRVESRSYWGRHEQAG
jgi:hypothetical protein